MVAPIALIAAAIPAVGGAVIRMVAPGLLKELGKKVVKKATAAQVKNAGKNIPTATKKQIISQSRVNVAKSKGKLPGRMGERDTPSQIAGRNPRGKSPTPRPDSSYRVGQEKPLTGELKFPRAHPGKVSSSDKASINPALDAARGSGTKVSRKGLSRKSGGSVKVKKYARGGGIRKPKGS